MADGKWITELTADTPLADAARRVLSVRLAVVHHYLPLAMRQADEDIEYVHQLRVATRRAGAALEIFSVCLPEKELRKAKKALRGVRRAAGEARDWDVFLDGLPGGKWHSHRLLPVRDLLLGYALARRVAAQDVLANASPNYPFAFERFQAETVAAVHKPKTEPEMRTLAELAQPMISRLLQELHEAACGDLDDYDHLHQVRIIGKRLRYAMEVFVDCFAPSFKDELYPTVEHMQELLGDANDSHVAHQRLTLVRGRLEALRPHDWRRYRQGLESLCRYHEDRLVEKRKEFIGWWQRWQETGGEENFRALLKPIVLEHNGASDATPHATHEAFEPNV
ncbi:MAG: CHAD domain-containing protein [Planctomycetia bacterium]|nr:CHAD domain-containing protein [Planctomycetia bacterium]